MLVTLHLAVNTLNTLVMTTANVQLNLVMTMPATMKLLNVTMVTLVPPIIAIVKPAAHTSTLNVMITTNVLLKPATPLMAANTKPLTAMMATPVLTTLVAE
jgi:hypothetical protein